MTSPFKNHITGEEQLQEEKPRGGENTPPRGREYSAKTGDHLPGLKLSFKLTERLNTRCSGVQSLLSGQK